MVLDAPQGKFILVECGNLAYCRECHDWRDRMWVHVKDPTTGRQEIICCVYCAEEE
jgi:hypothetical protein